MKARPARPLAATALEILALVSLGVLLLSGLVGCSASTAARSPSFHHSRPGLSTFAQTGDAAQPAQADTATGSASFAIPAGTPVAVAPDGTATFTAAEPVRVVSTFDRLTATGPAAFPPPAAPTPAAEADGRARLFAWIALGLGAALAAFGLVKAFPSLVVGGASVAAAGLVVIGAGFVPRWVWTLGICGAVLAAFGFALWHLYLKKRYVEHVAPFPRDSSPSPV